jgi:hypothetical protein
VDDVSENEEAMSTIEVYVAMNEDGDYEVAATAEDARQLLDDNAAGCACRIVRLQVTMSRPSYEEPIAVIEIPDETPATAAI